MKILNGTEVAAFIKERQAKQVRNLRQQYLVAPRLAIVQTMKNPVIDTYVRLKRRYADDILIETELHQIEQKQLIETIDLLNDKPEVHGIIVQLPLADISETDAALTRIAPQKDVDGLSGSDNFVAATPLAIDWLLAAYGVDLRQKSIAIVGAGRLVGAPLQQRWRQNKFDISVYDQATKDLNQKLLKHDLIVSATGVAGLIKSEMLKTGAMVIDAGTSSEDGVIKGDLASEVRIKRPDLTVTSEKGGVGPLTVAALLDNVILAAKNSIKLT